MPSPKVEKAIALAAQIEASRAETARLEGEFEDLVSHPRSLREARASNGHAVPAVRKRRLSKRPRFNGRQANKDRVLHALKTAKGPVKLLILRKQLKLSESCLFTNVHRLVKEKVVVKTGHGTYEAKS